MGREPYMLARKLWETPPMRLPSLAFCAALLASAPAGAWELSGEKTLFAVTREGREIAIGHVAFTPEGGRTRFAVAIDGAKFSDYFLSMREFKCLDGGVEIACRVPYPYNNPGWVTPTDFAWLEHALLFLSKKQSEVGANLWNGLYYRLALTDHGLIGQPFGVDLNQIASPPDDPATPPFGQADQGDLAAGSQWLARVEIR